VERGGSEPTLRYSVPTVLRMSPIASAGVAGTSASKTSAAVSAAPKRTCICRLPSCLQLSRVGGSNQPYWWWICAGCRFANPIDGSVNPIRFHDLRHTFGTLAVQAFPLTDVKAFMGHADIQTTMLYVHHVPQADAAEKLSRLVSATSNVVALPVLGHVRDTNAEPNAAPNAEGGSVAELSEWARLDSNQGPTDYESAALTS
jgi:hypothetical protein